MAEISQHTWDKETEIPTVLTRATVADGKYIQKDTIDPLINRDDKLKKWLDETNNALVSVSGELMDTISSVSSTLDTKIDTTSANLHEELTAASASLNTKIDTASGNIMSAMKTSADNLIQYTNSASAYVQGNLQTSADTLVSALNDLDNEFTTYLKTLCSAGEVGQVAVWENVSEGTYALSARPIVASPDNTNGFVESSGIKSYVDTQINEHVAGLFSFKGSKSVDEINALNNMSAGDVYNLTTNGIISAGEFGNMSAQSGDNIVYVTNDGAPHWDKMAAAFNDENCMKLVSSATSGNIATFNSKGQVEDLGIDPTNFGKCEVIQIEGSVGSPSFWSVDMTTTYYDKVLNAAKDALQNGKSLIIDVGSDREGSQCYYHRFALSDSNINEGSSSGWFEFKFIGDSFEVGTSEADATDNIGFRLYYGSSYEDKCELIEKSNTSSNLVIHINTGINKPTESRYFNNWKQYIPEILDALEYRDENNLMIETYTVFGTGRGGETYTWRYGGYYTVEGRRLYYFYNISQNATVIGIKMMPTTDAETGEPSLDFSVIYRSGPELKPGQGIDIIHNQSSLDHSLTINAYNVSGGEGIGVYTDDVNHVITISAKGGEAGNNSYLGNALAADCVVENPKYEIALGSAASAYGRAPSDKIPAPGNAIAIGAYSIASVKEDVNPYNENGAAIALGYACSSLGHTTVTIGNSACASGGGNIVIGNSCCYKADGDSYPTPHSHGVFAQQTFENFLYDSCVLGAHTGNEGYEDVASNIMLKDCVISGGEHGSLICNNFMWNHSYVLSDNARRQNPCHNMLLNNSLIVNGSYTDNNFVYFGELCDPATGTYDNSFCNNINFGGVIIADPANRWYCNNNVILSLGELGYGFYASAGGVGRRIYSESILKCTDVETMYAEMRRYSSNDRDSPIIYDSQKSFMLHDNYIAKSNMTHVIGETNCISGAMDAFINGNGNTLDKATHSYIQGSDNHVKFDKQYDGGGSYLIGQNNIVSGNPKPSDQGMFYNQFLLGVGNSAVDASNAFAVGVGLISNTNQIVLGRYNENLTITGTRFNRAKTNDVALLIVGNGSIEKERPRAGIPTYPPANEEAYITRSNAFVVYDDGHGEFGGDVVVKHNGKTYSIGQIIDALQSLGKLTD